MWGALGPVFRRHAAGNPLDEGWYCCLKQLASRGCTREMTQLARRLVFGLAPNWQNAGIPAQINAIGSL